MIELNQTWEYIALNIDLYRLAQLNCQWELKPSQRDSLLSVEHMITVWGGFKKQQEVKKAELPDANKIAVLDASKLKVVRNIVPNL